MNDITYSGEKQRLKIFKEGIAQFLTSDEDEALSDMDILHPFEGGRSGQLNESQIVQIFCDNLNILLRVRELDRLAVYLVEMQDMLDELAIELEFMGKINLPSMERIYTRIGQGVIRPIIDGQGATFVNREEYDKKLRQLVISAIEEELFFWS